MLRANDLLPVVQTILSHLNVWGREIQMAIEFKNTMIDSRNAAKLNTYG